MPRNGSSRGLIASRRARASAFDKRRKSLMKKAWELSVLCGVRVAAVCADGEGAAARSDVYESEEGVLAAYRALPAAARAAHTQRAYADAELGKGVAKLARVSQGGPAALPGWDKELNGADAEKARRVMGDIDAAMAAVEARLRALGVPVLAVDDGGLLEDVAPLRSAAPPSEGSDFAVQAEAYRLGVVQGGGDANGGRYEQAMWGNGIQPSSAAGMQLAGSYGFHQYPGYAAEMGGYQLQMGPGTNAHSDTRLAWDAFQPRPGYPSQCYGGCLPQPNLHNDVGFPSLNLGLSNNNNNAQLYGGGDFVNAPPALSSHAMGTGNNFMNPAPAQPLAAYAGGYTTQWPAQQQQQQLQSASSSQQSGIQQLHYFSDVEDGLPLWGN